MLLESNQKLSRMENLVAQAECKKLTFNKSHIPLTQQMDNIYNYLKKKINEAELELNTLTGIAESFFPPASSLARFRSRCSVVENEPHNRTRRLIGVVAALAAGTGSILGEAFKDAACNTVSISISAIPQKIYNMNLIK